MDDVRVWHDGHVWRLDNMYLIRDAVPGSGDDTSQGKVGLHHIYCGGADTPEWQEARLHVLPKLHARQERYDQAVSKREMAEIDLSSQQTARQLVADVDAGCWGGYDRLPKIAQERRQREQAYNNAVNEGGEGYIPYVPTQAEYDAAKRTI